MGIEQKIRFFIKTIFYLPGTTLHELAHYMGLVLMGFQNLSISLWPKNIMSGYEITMGSASGSLAQGQSSVRWIIPAFLPKFYLVPLYFLLSYYGLFDFELNSDGIEIGIYYTDIDWLSYETWIVLYIVSQLWWASVLSFPDWKMTLKGIFSLKGLILVAITYIIIDYISYDDAKENLQTLYDMLTAFWL